MFVSFFNSNRSESHLLLALLLFVERCKTWLCLHLDLLIQHVLCQKWQHNVLTLVKFGLSFCIWSAKNGAVMARKFWGLANFKSCIRYVVFRVTYEVRGRLLHFLSRFGRIIAKWTSVWWVDWQSAGNACLLFIVQHHLELVYRLRLLAA